MLSLWCAQVSGSGFQGRVSCSVVSLGYCLCMLENMRDIQLLLPRPLISFELLRAEPCREAKHVAQMEAVSKPAEKHVLNNDMTLSLCPKKRQSHAKSSSMLLVASKTIEHEIFVHQSHKQTHTRQTKPKTKQEYVQYVDPTTWNLNSLDRKTDDHLLSRRPCGCPFCLALLSLSGHGAGVVEHVQDTLSSMVDCV